MLLFLLCLTVYIFFIPLVLFLSQPRFPVFLHLRVIFKIVKIRQNALTELQFKFVDMPCKLITAEVGFCISSQLKISQNLFCLECIAAALETTKKQIRKTKLQLIGFISVKRVRNKKKTHFYTVSTSVWWS